jgi:hypothetical protein
MLGWKTARSATRAGSVGGLGSDFYEKQKTSVSLGQPKQERKSKEEP